MTIDSRAIVTCSLGPLISGNISDDYFQETGLIKIKGNCIIKGLISPAIGTSVTFTYTRNGVTRTIPRVLSVISSFADPFARTTTVDLGCTLTLNERNADESEIYASEDPANDGLTEEDLQIITTQISASTIASKCATGLGVSGGAGLTNKFSVAKFDLSGGYFSVLSDLLVSECYCGYSPNPGTLSVFNLSLPASAGGAVLDKNNIISISPIGTGQVPPGQVTVSYSTLRLKDPEPVDVTEQPTDPDNPDDPKPEPQKFRDWELDVYYGYPTYLPVSYTDKNTGEPEYSEFKFTPYEKTITKYDKWDRVISRETYTRVHGANVNSSVISAALSSGLGPLYADEFTLKSETVYKYKIAAYDLSKKIEYSEYPEGYPEFEIFKGTVNEQGDLPVYPNVNTGDYYKVKMECYKEYIWDGTAYIDRLRPYLVQEVLRETYPEGYDEVSEEITTTQTTNLAIAGMTGGSYFDPETGEFAEIFYHDGIVTESITTVKYETISRNVGLYRAPEDITTLDIPITKVTTRTQKLFCQTASGQAYLSSLVEDYGLTASELIGSASRLVEDEGGVRTTSGREATVQMRPALPERIYAENSKSVDRSKQDPTSISADYYGGYSTYSSSEMEFISGGGGDNIVTYNMPYAPDDTFQRVGVCPDIAYNAIKSDAPQKARSYGLTQSRLAFGNRYGMNIQTLPEYLPSRPNTTFVVRAGNVSGLYATNAFTWTFDSNGIIASVDALFIGGLGAAPGSEIWFPVAPGVTLPSEPAIVDTSPDQIIGSIPSVGASPQTALGLAFPGAVNGDGVLDEETNDIWVYDGTDWINRGENPGPSVEDAPVAPVWNERILLTGRVRLNLQIKIIPYSLNLPIIDLQPAVRLDLIAPRVIPVYIPNAVDGSTIDALAPLVTENINVRIVGTLDSGTIDALAPVITENINIRAVAADSVIDVGTGIQVVTGAYGTYVNPPSVVISIDTLIPRVASSITVNPPSAVIDINSLIPRINPGAVIRPTPANITITALAPTV